MPIILAAVLLAGGAVLGSGATLAASDSLRNAAYASGVVLGIWLVYRMKKR